MVFKCQGNSGLFTDLTLNNDWDDIYATYRVMWDEDNFYFFTSVYDDQLSNTGFDAHENDGIELYFDAENLKNNGSYINGNDIQWRWVYMKPAPDPGPEHRHHRPSLCESFRFLRGKG